MSILSHSILLLMVVLMLMLMLLSARSCSIQGEGGYEYLIPQCTIAYGGAYADAYTIVWPMLLKNLHKGDYFI